MTSLRPLFISPRAISTSATFMIAVLATAMFTTQLSAQRKLSKLDGAWRHVSTQTVTPDSTYLGPVLSGLGLFFGRHYCAVFLNAASPGGRQTARPSTIEEKADRYDALDANAGTFELTDGIFTKHGQYADNPARVATAPPQRFRVRGDTFWVTATRPWHADSSKVIRRTSVFVRVPPAVNALTRRQRALQTDGVWRHIRMEIVTPESTFAGTRFQGLVVQSGGHYAVVMLNADHPGIRQASRPSTTEQKAERYDAITANAGTIAVSDTLFAKHIEVATNPLAVGATPAARYRLSGDTLWLTAAHPWLKDTSKRVQRTDVLVRLR